MTRRQGGFSLVELMITMVIFVFVIASVSQIFVGLLSQFKQQSKVAETNIEGIVGLNMLRRDMEHAGYGLPWNLSGAAYQEALNTPSPAVSGITAQNDESFNDGPPNNPARGAEAAGLSHPPGAFRSGDGVGFNGSDVLVIKAVNVALSDASQKWTYIITGNTAKEWDQPRERMETSDRAIVINFFGGTRTLVSSGGTFTARYVRNNPYLDVNPDSLSDAGFAPPDETEQRIVYGVAEPGSPVTTALRMPFNRADYYIRQPGVIPVRCAANTGILYKAVLTQAGALGPEMPLLDCVADMQVIYRRDTDGDGDIDTSDTDISGLTSEQIRTTLRDVRVYILTHEGQRDPRFTFTNLVTCTAGPNAGNNVCVRVSDSANASWGRDFDLTTITDYEQYRWKVYTLAVQPFLNLR